jgi:hypothetical protein
LQYFRRRKDIKTVILYIFHKMKGLTSSIKECGNAVSYLERSLLALLLSVILTPADAFGVAVAAFSGGG